MKKFTAYMLVILYFGTTIRCASISASNTINDARTIIKLMGKKAMAEIAFVAYCTQCIASMKKQAAQSSLINNFKNNELPKMSLTAHNKKVTQFLASSDGVHRAFKILLKDTKFHNELKNIAQTHFTKFEKFYIKQTKITMHNTLYINIIATLEAGVIDPAKILDPSQLESLAFQVFSIQNDNEIPHYQDFYKSLLNKIFTAFGNQAPAYSLLEHYAIPIMIIGITATAATIVYLMKNTHFLYKKEMFTIKCQKALHEMRIKFNNWWDCRQNDTSDDMEMSLDGLVFPKPIGYPMPPAINEDQEIEILHREENISKAEDKRIARRDIWDKALETNVKAKQLKKMQKEATRNSQWNNTHREMLQDQAESALIISSKHPIGYPIIAATDEDETEKKSRRENTEMYPENETDTSFATHFIALQGPYSQEKEPAIAIKKKSLLIKLSDLIYATFFKKSEKYLHTLQGPIQV